ncbi:hypothetical protein R1flu_019869 [Riccia fluitans]|uniref:Uncharacterized protein n=1 Tax=Riccia fluitans TaxID=41844 RepID=A0ABD1ZM31_9MARC
MLCLAALRIQETEESEGIAGWKIGRIRIVGDIRGIPNRRTLSVGHGQDWVLSSSLLSLALQSWEMFSLCGGA